MNQERILLRAQNLKKDFVVPQSGLKRFRRSFSQWRSSPSHDIRTFTRHWAESRQVVHALDDVSLSIKSGEIVGLVGRSGSGKTTLARLLLRLLPLTEGRIWFDGKEVTNLNQAEMRPHRKKIRMMFQSPAAALNPMLTIRQILTEAIHTQTGLPRKAWDSELRKLLPMVKLPSNVLEQYPGDLSGGLQRRVSIARTLVGNPKLIIADEPVAALDTSIQAQIVTLIKQINQTQGVAFLLISHDLAMVRYVSNRFLFMNRGRLVWPHCARC